MTPSDGEILVTGASGGVGGVAIAVLAKLGYRVAASTGRPAEGDYLHSLGASEIIDRAELSEPGRTLGPERLAGAVDTVGGQTLALRRSWTPYQPCGTDPADRYRGLSQAPPRALFADPKPGPETGTKISKYDLSYSDVV
jgi:NAD(P)-dependent dehydrogenase (short-subunit alcohol dehydrogenase family)